MSETQSQHSASHSQTTTLFSQDAQKSPRRHIHEAVMAKRQAEAAYAAELDRRRQYLLAFIRKYPERSLPQTIIEEKRGLCSFAMRHNPLAAAAYEANRKTMDLKLQSQEAKNNKREGKHSSAGPDLDVALLSRRSVNKSHEPSSHSLAAEVEPVPQQPIESRRPTIDKHTKRFSFKVKQWLTHKLDDEGQDSVAWLNERLHLSCRSCRFELPMDMRQFEKMTAQDYIVKYCKIPAHRQMIYKKFYNKHKNKFTGLFGFEDLEKCVHIILSHSVEEKDLHRFLRCLSFHEGMENISLPLFSATCAVAERITYCSFINKYGQTGINRGFLEHADFSNLEWKLKGIEIDPYLKRLLVSLGA